METKITTSLDSSLTGRIKLKKQYLESKKIKK